MENGTEQSLRQALVTGFDRNVLVEAGAGAGKSTLIVNRIINQILADASPLKDDQPIGLAEIVAITFTEKAANELQYKFQKKLRERYNQETDASRKEKLRAAMNEVDRMFINTVHAFCLQLLSEYPFEAGLTIGFRPIDERENRMLLDRIWNRFVTSPQVKAGNDHTEKLRDAGFAPGDLKGFYAKVCQHRSLGMAISGGGVTVNPYAKMERCLEELHNIIQSFDAKERTIIKKGDIDKNKKKKKSPVELLQEMFGGAAHRRRQLVLDFMDGFVKLHSIGDLFNKKVNDNPLSLAIKSKFSIEDVKTWYSEYLQYVHHISQDFVMEACAMYEEAKRKEMRVTFDDLLYKTYLMLRNSKEARAFFRRKYKCIYVDEFQDTDPVQTKILFLLTAENDDHDGHWQQYRPRPGSLFMVGDPKQSIYRFRQADIAIYDSVKKLVRTLPDWEFANLKWNYRSNPDICDWVESRFMLNASHSGEEDEGTNQGSGKFYFNDETKPYQAVFTGMESQTQRLDEDDNLLNGVYTYSLQSTKAGDLLQEDSRFIADSIRQLVLSGMHIQDSQAGGGPKRPIRYGDFLILVSTTKGMMTYVDALKQAGIPVSFAGKISLYDVHEAANLIDLVSFLNDYRNAVKMVGVLRNGFGLDLKAINAETLSTRLLFDDEKIDALLNKSLQAALRKLKLYLEWKRVYHPVTVVEKIIEDYEAILNRQYGRDRFRSVAGTLYAMLELVKKQEYAAFHELACAFEEMKDIDIDRELPIEYDLDEDGEYHSVRIMNLHKAKGLEGNIVILAKPSGDFSFPMERCVERSEEQEYAHLCVTKTASGSYRSIVGKPHGWDAREAEERRFAAAERLRLLYVAATRAARVLLISQAPNAKYSKSPWLPLLNGTALRPFRAGIPDATDAGEPVPDQDFAADIAKLQHGRDAKRQSMERLMQPSYVETSPSDLDNNIDHGSRQIVAAPHEDENREEAEASLEPGTEPYGPVWGTIVHRMFELYLIKRQIAGRAWIDSEKDILIRRAIHETIEQMTLSGKALRQLQMEPISLDLPPMKTARIVAERLQPALENILDGFANHRKLRLELEHAEQIMPEMPFYLEVSRGPDDPREERLYRYLLDHTAKKNKKLQVEESDDQRVFRVSGIMDLVLRTGDRYQIIDYKTNRMRPDMQAYLIRTYESQLMTYRLILEKLTNGRVDGLVIYSTALDETIGL